MREWPWMEGYPGQGTMAAHSPGWDHALRDARLAVGSRGQRCDHRSPPHRKSVASTTRHFVRAIPLAARRISRRRTVRRPARLIPATAPYCLIDPPHYPVDRPITPLITVHPFPPLHGPGRPTTRSSHVPTRISVDENSAVPLCLTSCMLADRLL